jgi:diaminopimelate decarboxylase
MRPNNFNFKDGILNVEDMSLDDVLANFSTPFYIYTKASILESCEAYLSNIESTDLVCFAVKANSNLQLLKILAEAGLGFDVVSGGELSRVIKIGADPKKIVFSGVGKTKAELAKAAELEIFSINVESSYELENIIELEKNPRVSFRINPDMSGDTHPYIETGKADCKFGISEVEAISLAKKYSPEEINLVGITAHIGSQITNTDLFLELLEKLKSLASQFEAYGHSIDHLDVGGGLAIDYKMENNFNPSELVKELKANVGNYSLLLEPGRSMVAQAGALITKVIGEKENGDRKFLIVDAAMNDLMRPSLYNARHEIENIIENTEDKESYTVVGPVCETADSFGDEFKLSAKADDHLIIYSSGAYGSSMGSNYNSRLRPAEILIDAGSYKIIRREESFDDLIKLEEI